jgi:hypothetical protein
MIVRLFVNGEDYGTMSQKNAERYLEVHRKHYPEEPARWEPEPAPSGPLRCAGSDMPALPAYGNNRRTGLGKCAVCGGMLAKRKSGRPYPHKDFRTKAEKTAMSTHKHREEMSDEEHCHAIAQEAAELVAALLELFDGRLGLFAIGGETVDGSKAGLVVICNEETGCEKLLELVDAYQADSSVTAKSVTGNLVVRGAGNGGVTH